MHDLELQLVAVAELVEWLLTREQRSRVQVDLVIESAATLHLPEKVFAVHASHSRVGRAGHCSFPGRARRCAPEQCSSEAHATLNAVTNLSVIGHAIKRAGHAAQILNLHAVLLVRQVVSEERHLVLARWPKSIGRASI